MDLKAFISKSLLLGVPMLLAFMSVNFFGDASLLFEPDFELKMSEILLDGGMIENFYDYDERLFQKEVIINQKENPELVILGSSRGMLLNTATFDSTYTLMNNSVSGATHQDQIALYQCYRLQGKQPKKVYLSFEPWTLNRNNEQKRWASLTNEYMNFFDPAYYQDPGFPWVKWAQLVSPSYFQASLQTLFKGNGSRDPKRAKDPFNETNTKLTDGSLVYSDPYRLATPEEIEKRVAKYMTGDIYSIENYTELDPQYQGEYAQFVDTLLAHEVELTLFMEPYFPKMWKEAERNYPMIRESENWLIKLAEERNIQVIGSFNPHTLGLDSSAFYDAMHLKYEVVQELFDPTAED